jgi:hypothetical protein
MSFLMLLSALEAAVVVAVSTDVWTAVPLMVTLTGFRLHEGMSLAFVNDVVTLQLRFTVPANPFVPSMLIVPVFPVVAPGVTDMEVVPPLPTVKLGSGVMLRETLVVAPSVPEVPVTVTVTGVEVTSAEVRTASVRISVPDTDPAAKDGVTPLGKPVAASVTLPEKPPTSATVIVLVPLPPCATDMVAGEADNVKLGDGLTMTDAAPVATLYMLSPE